MKNKSALLLSIIIAISLILTGCQEKGVEFKIGVLLDSHVSYTDDARNGIKLAVSQYLQKQNSDGLNKIDIKLIFRDCGLEAKDAMEATRELIYQSEVNVIIGPNSSRAAIPASLIAQQTKVPMISNGSSHDETTKNKSYIYRTVSSDNQNVDKLIDYLKATNRIGRAAILFDKANVYSNHIAELFTLKYHKLGGEILSFYYITGEESFSEVVAKIKASNAELLLLPNFPKEIRLQLEQIKNHNLGLDLYGVDSWEITEASKLVPKQGATIASISHPIHFAGNLQSERFIEDYQHRYKDRPSIGAAISYDTTNIILRALSGNGSVSREAFNQALKVIDYQGVSGRIRFDHQGNIISPVRVFRIFDGKITVVPY